MGLMLSVLVMCVGVLEAISAVNHIRESYLPLEFKRRKRRMVVDLGTGSVRHVDISWPGDVPRGSHVIRRRSGMMSPHSSFDLDDDTSRRTSVHFDPVQLERAVADILLEEDPTEESEDTSITQPVLESRLEFSTRLTETAPINELRQETEPLPGNRPSLPAQPDIVDPKTPAPQTDRPPRIPHAESDSVTSSEKISTERFINPIEESSYTDEFISSDSPPPISASSLPTETPPSIHTIDQRQNGLSKSSWHSNNQQLNKAEIPPVTSNENYTCATVSKDGDQQTNKLEALPLPEGIPPQDSPTISPATSETAISSVTEISDSVSTKSVLFDESSDKSEENIPEDLSADQTSVESLRSLEEPGKSTNNLILCQVSDQPVPSSSEVYQATGKTEQDEIGTEHNGAAASAELIDPTLKPTATEIDTSIPKLPTGNESTWEPNDSEVEDSDISVSSVVQSPLGKSFSSAEVQFTEENIKLSSEGAPGYADTPKSVPDVLDFGSDRGKPLPQYSAKESETSATLNSFHSPISDKKEEPALVRGLSHGSTNSQESIEELSNASCESQSTPRLPLLEESIVSEHDTKNDEVVQSSAVDVSNVSAGTTSYNVSREHPKEDLDRTDHAKDVDLVPSNIPSPIDLAPAQPSEIAEKGNTVTEECDQSEFSPVTVHTSNVEILSQPKEEQPNSETNHPSIKPSNVPAAVPEESQDSAVENLQGLSNVAVSCLQPADLSNSSSREGIEIQANDDVQHISIAALTHDGMKKEHKTQDETEIVLGSVSSAVNGSSQQPEETKESIISNTDDQDLSVRKNDLAKRKSLIETENIVISTHQIESDENVSAQQATQSDLTHSATLVEGAGSSNVLVEPISAVLREILPGDVKVVGEGCSAVSKIEDNCEIDKDENQPYGKATSSGNENVVSMQEAIAEIDQTSETSRDIAATSSKRNEHEQSAEAPSNVLSGRDDEVELLISRETRTDQRSSDDGMTIPEPPCLRNGNNEEAVTPGGVSGNSITIKTLPEGGDGLQSLKSIKEAATTDRLNFDGEMKPAVQEKEQSEQMPSDDGASSANSPSPGSDFSPNGTKLKASQIPTDRMTFNMDEETKPAVQEKEQSAQSLSDDDIGGRFTERLLAQSDDHPNGTKLKENPIPTDRLTPVVIDEAKSALPVQKNEERESRKTSSNDAVKSAADDTPKRDDGPMKSKSNEKKNDAKTEQSNASEVKQDITRVSSIDDSAEIVKVAASAPSDPQMEDIPAPTADTSPDKAFWVRD